MKKADRPSPHGPSSYRPSSLPALLGVMACVAAGFFLMLKIGFIIHHDPQPAPIDSRALTAAAILIFFTGVATATFMAVQSGGRARGNSRMRKKFKEEVSERAAARRRRAGELAADPAKAWYAPLVERGEDWSDEQIAYHENLELTVTCAHLQQIERAMREAGINLRWVREKSVIAKCRIDFPELQRAFYPAASVRYAEFYQGDPEYHEYPAAFLICEVHNSMIHTLHPDEQRNAPVFPNLASLP